MQRSRVNHTSRACVLTAWLADEVGRCVVFARELTAPTVPTGVIVAQFEDELRRTLAGVGNRCEHRVVESLPDLRTARARRLQRLRLLSPQFLDAASAEALNDSRLEDVDCCGGGSHGRLKSTHVAVVHCLRR